MIEGRGYLILKLLPWTSEDPNEHRSSSSLIISVKFELDFQSSDFFCSILTFDSVSERNISSLIISVKFESDFQFSDSFCSILTFDSVSELLGFSNFSL